MGAQAAIASLLSDGWTANPGYLPAEAVGKRVMVLLAHGRPGRCDDNPMSPPGWAADTTCWRKRGSAFDVAFYRVVA